MGDARLIHPSYPATPIDVMYYPPSLRPTGEIWQTHSSVNSGAFVAYSILAIDVSTAYNLRYTDVWPLATAESYLAYTGLQGCVQGQPWTTCASKFKSDQPLSIKTGAAAGSVHAVRLITLAPQL